MNDENVGSGLNGFILQEPNDRQTFFFWKTKTGVLIGITVICALLMCIASSLNFSSASSLSYHENSAIKELETIVEKLKENSKTSTSYNPTQSTSGFTRTTSGGITPSISTGRFTGTTSGFSTGSTGWFPETTSGSNTASTSGYTGTTSPPICSTSELDRYDCHPEAGASETKCQQRGCCWIPTAQKPATYADPAPVNIPQCFFPKNYNGYEIQDTSLNNDGRSDGVLIKLKRRTPSGLPVDETDVIIRAIKYNYNVARITIDSANGGRWIPPLPPIADQSTDRDVSFTIRLSGVNNSTLSILRYNNEAPLFSIELSTLIFSRQFIQVTTSLPSNKVYGLGEMKGPLLHSVNYTRRILFNKDQPPRYNRALYGAHGLMLNLDVENLASGVFIKNSNPMDVVLTPKPAATYRAIGGIFDFFIFTGPSPQEVFSQYQSLVGLPTMVPYWSLGYHLCRYGYWSLNKTIETYNRNIQAKVPLEVQWNDIDYMDRFNMFTYDKKNFDGLADFVEEVHRDGRKYVMIFDPAVSGGEPANSYRPYDLGVQMDIFVKNMSNQIVEYKVWNDLSSIFPDFSNPKTSEFWKILFNEFHDEVPFDGAWIDMNEPSNQRNGTKLTDTCPKTGLDFPPVIIGGEALFTYTACMSDHMHLSNHYDLHNLYPHFEARATYKALTAARPEKRPFIISRASSPGQGLWSGHWTGDIDSTWEDMRQSIPDIINFAMYGMPMLGADICGFQYNTTDELCARWQALGAFYPFSRNHNDKFQREQDPAILGGDVLNATITTLQKKYLFAPYLYTLIYRAHAFGETVFRAMMFNFNQDPETHSLDEQFMWGTGLLIAPALYPNQTDVQVYLPAGLWYHYNDNGKVYKQEQGDKIQLPAPINDINLLFYGGNIIPGQDTTGDTLSKNRENGFLLYVALDSNKSAHGQLFWDDGDTIDTVDTGVYSLIEFDASYNTIVTRALKAGYRKDKLELKTIHVFGVETSPSQLFINGVQIRNANTDYFRYDNQSQQLLIHNIDNVDLLSQSNSIVFI